ncbi:Stk1 family PASTA domain-containing Ser/Thr kinase [Halanaerobacter jeridensis]|uniref:non-specific serine/threonine protein kinase n=1 Tax=Halanaerobacter jeridensis TaxID=706427 RepID=A0A939BR14_9FIRM|nr:Stk1 family PASTA domain-containing Ser/Thr kinase [Halanaerobacter jeridensis]MBM7555516.1 serine/threonine-protein kinase [Halanaerobacter jeridensis]
MIGKLLNNRYKLVEKIGTGGMAIVYRAEDRHLSREVAVKILQPQFADNDKAVKRFRHEAKSVASLNHPNIINIFDIGQDDETEYIIMEYITGQDLKEKINQEGKLPTAQAIRIIEEVCQALIKAHRNNIVHCDIKPHNILLTSDERVKVTDFGIAQAVTDATMEQTDSIIGSAHYLSPEQARGSRVTTKSDLYSLGIVLYELVTGKLPFEGENSVSVALKHVKDKPPSPLKYNGDLSPQLVDIIMKSLAKKPSERYNSANEFLRDLKELDESLDHSEISNQETMIISPEEMEAEKTKVQRKTNDIKDLDKTDLESEQNNDKNNTQNTKQPQTKSKQKNSLSFWTVALTLVVLGVALLGIAYYFYLDYVTVPKVTVPNVVGQSFSNAEKTLEKEGLKLEVYYKTYSSETPKNHVISQSPKPKETVRKKRVISLVISKGAELSVVPDFKGISLRKVKVELDKKDLVLGTVEREYSPEVEEGRVISQTPAVDKKVKSKTKVDLVVSKGPEPQKIGVPNLVGLKKEEAVEKLRAENLILGQVTQRKSLNYYAGRVIAQQPASGAEVVEGSTMKLIISSGIRNPYDSEVRKSNINIEVTPGQDKEVKIVVQDDNGQRIVYQKVHQSGATVYEEIITVGPAILRVYFNDKLVSEKTIR